MTEREVRTVQVGKKRYRCRDIGRLCYKPEYGRDATFRPFKK